MVWNICPRQIYMLQFLRLKVREEKVEMGDVFTGESTEGYGREVRG